MEESNNVSPQQNQAVQISPELNGENVYNEVNRSLTLMSRFLREEQFNAQKALRAKTVIQNAQTSIKNSLSEAILALEFGSHESNSNMLENLIMDKLKEEDTAVDTVIDELFEEKKNAVLIEDLVNAVYIKVLSSVFTENKRNDLKGKLKTKIRAISKPSGKFVAAGSVQSGNLVQKVQAAKKILGGKFSDLWIFKNCIPDHQLRYYPH